MKLCRFQSEGEEVRVGMVVDEGTLVDLHPAGIKRLSTVLDAPDAPKLLANFSKHNLPRHAIRNVRLCAPVDHQEVWAAGVTYLRSKKARMEESDFSASAYDRVYAAERPELFFKSLPQKVAGPGAPVGIRRDARWSVPEPELALVLNRQGTIVGCTAGNDMSSRDIEGENLLYLPQAKIFERSCALGPWIILAVPEDTVRTWQISVSIRRQGKAVFSGRTSVDRIKRTFAELAGFLFRSQSFPEGAVLLTGTGVVPPDDFTLEAGDIVAIEISGIGILENPVIVV